MMVQKLLDLAAMMAAFGAAFLVVWGKMRPVDLGEFLWMRVKVWNFLVLLGLLLGWYLLFLAKGLYGSRRMASVKDEVRDVGVACTAGTILVMLAGWVFSIQVVGWLFLLVFWAGSIVFTLGERLALRGAMRLLRRRGRNLRYLLIVGTNERARAFAKEVEKRPELGYRLVGFADDEWEGMEEFRKGGGKVVTDLSGLKLFLLENVVDEVVVCLPMRSLYLEASRVVEACREQGITVRYMGRVFEGARPEGVSVDIGLEPVVTVSSGLMEGWPGLVKRGIDLLVSGVGSVVLLPVFGVIALLIKLDSPGPVFFTQERKGLKKRTFRMFKFRTMVEGAERTQEEMEKKAGVRGPIYKWKDDPRVTRVGRWLRRTSLDELPQLWNVFRGEMSLVGPRPLTTREHDRLPEEWKMRRSSVRPGMTGLWQVNGRSEVGPEEWMELDLAYLDHWSLGLDLKILLKTVWAVVRGKGAV